MKTKISFRRYFLVAIYLQALAACFLLEISAIPAAAQNKKPSPDINASAVTIHGKVAAKHSGLSVAGLRYHSWQRVDRGDTAVTDAGGKFTLRLTVPRAWEKNIARDGGVPINVYQLADSAAFSVVERVYVSALPFDTSVTIELYPQVVLPDGSLPKSFIVPRFSSTAGDARQFIGRELNYPEDAREAGIQGTVVVRFLVDEEGTLSSPEIVRGVGGGCSEEVLRVVRKMPAWIPGEVDGKRAAMMYYMPLKFTLE